ncbi:hypothetical protein AFLA_014075 [Aspergillus flavus NRRL3357]|nr:hypothetical protein AFLA_014075 [Aspergillus flavus NRRL3357]
MELRKCSTKHWSSGPRLGAESKIKVATIVGEGRKVLRQRLTQIVKIIQDVKKHGLAHAGTEALYPTSYEPTNPADLQSFGPTRRAPLRSIVLARSGDKGGHANVGLWVRSEDEWDWLRTFLSTPSFKTLLGDDYRPKYRVERFELPHRHAVHFVTSGILQEDIPLRFLERPWV